MKNFEDFVEKMKKTIPDPIVSFLTTKPRMSVRQFKIIWLISRYLHSDKVVFDKQLVG
jgi:hypothetical protein